MTEYGTIRIPRDDYEKHNDRRQDLGLTWAEYIDGNAPNDREGVDPDELAGEVAHRFDYAELASKTADELEGRMR